MLSEISDEEVAAAIDACAADVLWEAGINGPPIDAFAIAEQLDLVVTWDLAMPHRGRFVRLAGQQDGQGAQGTIIVGAAERPEREQWAIAHEIGESVAYRAFERLGVSFDESLATAREHVANRMASALLLPRRWFAADGAEHDWDLFELKNRYNSASHELIARRMLDMRPPVVITLCDLGRPRWRRSNISSRPPEMLPAEQQIWQAVHRTGSPESEFVDVETGLERVRCWPIHEPDWKREILRSEIVEF
jgi:hypothetical protein